MTFLFLTRFFSVDYFIGAMMAFCFQCYEYEGCLDVLQVKW